MYILPAVCIAQNFCKYNKPNKFKEYEQKISSEHAGLLLNGINLYKKQFQIEGNSYIGSIINSYNKPVYAGFLQFRYAIISSVEVQVGGMLQNPPEINTDTLYNKQFFIGLKQRIFNIQRKTTEWNLALSAKYVLQQSWTDGNHIRNGILLSLNNSWKLFHILQLDLAGGSLYFPSENLFQPLLSGKVLLKDELSKIGISLGFLGDYYTESLVSIGLLYSDNINFILQVSAGFLDKAITPNISYTHVFPARN